MFERIIASAVIDTLDGAEKVAKKVSEKVGDIQKSSFEQRVKKSRKANDGNNKIWIVETSIATDGAFADNGFRRYSVYDVNDNLIYQATCGNVASMAALEVIDQAGNQVAFIKENGSRSTIYTDYAICENGKETDAARHDHTILIPSIELKSKKWKLHYDLSGIKKIDDAQKNIIAEVNKKSGKRRLISIYTEDRKTCILLLLLGMMNALKMTVIASKIDDY